MQSPVVHIDRPIVITIYQSGGATLHQPHEDPQMKSNQIGAYSDVPDMLAALTKLLDGMPPVCRDENCDRRGTFHMLQDDCEDGS